MATIEKGSKVQVFEDPVTCIKSEGFGTVTKILEDLRWNDEAGNAMIRCNVRFKPDQSHDKCVYERNVSRLAA